MSRGCALWVRGSKGQGLNALITENSFAFPLHLSSWNWIHRLPMKQGYAIWVLGSNGQGHNALLTENGFIMHDCFSSTPIETSYNDSPLDEDMPYWFWGQNVQGHDALITKNGLCCIIAFPLRISSWNFTQRLPMSRGCVLLILGVKIVKIKVTMNWLASSIVFWQKL